MIKRKPNITLCFDKVIGKNERMVKSQLLVNLKDKRDLTFVSEQNPTTYTLIAFNSYSQLYKYNFPEKEKNPKTKAFKLF